MVHLYVSIVNFLEWCIEYGIIECTVYAFSTENWKRDVTEVQMMLHIMQSDLAALI